MDPAVNRLLTLKVKDVMTRDVVCVHADQTADEAAARFVRARISGAPVVDAHGVCVGVLSATDYVSPRCPDDSAACTDGERKSVGDLMSRGVQSVGPEQTLLTAARLMCIKHLHRLPVLDHESRPVGLLTAMDAVAALVNAIDEREAATM